MAIYKKLGDFNDVLEYYQEILHWASNMYKGEFRAKTPRMNSACMRFLINNAGVSVAKNFEYIKKHRTATINDDILKILDSLGEDNGLKDNFLKIMEENDLTPMETLQSIRNSILHGDYHIDFNIDSIKDFTWVKIKDKSQALCILENSGNTIKIYDEKLDGRKVKGEIDVDLFNTGMIELLYREIRQEACAKDYISIWSIDKKLNYLPFKNRALFKKYLDSLMFYKIVPKANKIFSNKQEIIDKLKSNFLSSGNDMIFAENILKNIKEDMERIEKFTGQNSFIIEEFSKEEIEKRKKQLIEYVEFMGYNKMQDLFKTYPDLIAMIYDECIGTVNGEEVGDCTANLFFMNLLGYANSKDPLTKEKDNCMYLDDRYDRKLLIAHLYEAPSVFTNILLGMINFSCVYLKENNSNNGMNLFDYYDLSGFDGINFIHDSDGCIKKGENSESKIRLIDNQIMIRKRQIEKLEEDISDLNTRITEKNPKRQIFEEKREKKRKMLESVQGIVDVLEKRKMTFGTNYDDYSTFFRHLRNSIAHGRYSIDFSKALKKKDFSYIKFTFMDYNENSSNSSIPEFEVELTAGKILKIIHGIKKRVNDQLKLEGTEEIIDRIYLEDIISEEELDIIREKRIRHTPKDLKKNGFITEEDEIQSLEINEDMSLEEGENISL